MRLVLVDNLLLDHGSWTHHFDLQPHLGLISLIAVAEANGHEGILYDPKLAIARGELALDEPEHVAHGTGGLQVHGRERLPQFVLGEHHDVDLRERVPALIALELGILPTAPATPMSGASRR